MSNIKKKDKGDGKFKNYDSILLTETAADTFEVVVTESGPAGVVEIPKRAYIVRVTATGQATPDAGIEVGDTFVESGESTDIPLKGELCLELTARGADANGLEILLEFFE